jgi:NAD+ kinase
LTLKKLGVKVDFQGSMKGDVSMTMPLNLVLVRHGESEGNVAQALVKKGDSSLMAKLDAVHTQEWRLSPRGCNQAAAAGEWLRREFPAGFTRYLTSWYARAIETAGLLEMPGAEWLLHPMLSERDWGRLSSATAEQRATGEMAENLARRERDGVWWRPGGGESLADVLDRLHAFFDSLHREQSNGSVIIVCHGEVMWAVRVLIERMTPQRFRDLDRSRRNLDRIHNGHILHYTRINPEGATDVRTRLDWMRSICPWDPARSTNDWQTIQRPVFTGPELLAMVEQHRRFLEE